ncbi:uncharacterized protein LOC106770090 [Vigna radiata var. radiata]|uniref:Uncharacterized protein LOC106770090 n=1 Tax=Vigna radiata var. radiata TaxID=3916 RepID=A0A1S3UZN5_VIGRR|nr:uncharacterized protein LOC106770090 [Vigna radiata var. radiata]
MKTKTLQKHRHQHHRQHSERQTVMGFLLVFFPEDTIAAKIKNKTKTKTNLLCSSSSFKRSSINTLLSRAQSTLSICLLLLFTILLVFTLSTFQPSTPHKPHYTPHNSSNDAVSPALQRLGTLYRRGTRAMNHLLLCHVSQDTPIPHLRLFLRLLHRSGLTSKSDVVFILPSSSPSFASLLHDENNSFLSLVTLHARLNSTRPSDSTFDVSPFLNSPGRGEPLWGIKIRSFSNSSQSKFTRASYGSVLSFNADELDPENSLAGFLDRVPLSLRRWACYPMLLGRVRRNFKHVMLVDVSSVLIFNDPLGRFRNRSPDSVFVFPKRGRNSERTQSHRHVNSAVMMGGARGIRRISQATLVEIVRASVQLKRKNSVSDSAILSQLASNEFVLKNVDLIVGSEPLPEPSSFALGATSFWDHLIIQRGVSNSELNSIVNNQICSSVIDSFVYSDCQQSKN